VCVYGPRQSQGHKHAKQGLGQYLAILTSCLVNDPYIYYFDMANQSVIIGRILIIFISNPNFAKQTAKMGY